MPGPLFSIVTVTLDAGDALRRTAASVAAQTWVDLEHLVKDGASKDGSVGDVGGLPRVRVVSAPDRGIYDAMNQALSLCQGRFVLFLNAGDVFASPDALERVAAHVLRDDADLYYCDLVCAPLPVPVRHPARLSRFFLYRTQVCHQACFYRLDAYRRIGGFDTSFRFAADAELLLRAVVRARLRARRVPIAATIYEGGGFSARPENWPAVAAENRRARARHYSRLERAAFGAILSLSLPRLRGELLRAERLRAIRPIYQRLVNAWNRLG
jgi:glycosyltransferase involved in cell wall biosynthesis